MKKLSFFNFLLIVCLLLASCGQKTDKSSAETTNTSKDTVVTTSTADVSTATNIAILKDGKYSADFKTDSSMFHINEAHHGKGTLTVKDGKMTIHITLPSKNTVNLFYGIAEDAKKEGASLITPTLDTVTYDDGMTEEVYGFDVPVPYLDDTFDCALIGKKGVWYDHKVSVSNPSLIVDDGEYTANVTLTGGTGRASITSPVSITVKDGKATAEIVWSSPNYEYMKLGDIQYDRVNTEGNSTFLIPVVFDSDIKVSALTTAMSAPHLIDYTLRFDSGSLNKK